MTDNNAIDLIIDEIQSLYVTKAKEEDLGKLITVTKNIVLDDFITSPKVDIHVITREYPEMNTEEKNRLKQDIVMRSQVYSPFLAIIDDGKIKIFDGRNRYNLLKEINNDFRNDKESGDIYKELKEIELIIEIYLMADDKTRKYTKPDEETVRLISDSYNLSRRHLTATQKAIIAFSDRFQKQRKYFREQSEAAQITNRKNKPRNGRTESNESRAVFNESLAEVVGGNKDYISKWKRIRDIIEPQSPEIYRKLSEIAYVDNGNFQEIVHLLKFKTGFDSNKKASQDDSETLVIKLCKAYIEAKEKNSNLPFGQNEQERKRFIDNLKIEVGVFAPKESESKTQESKLNESDKKNQVKELRIFINNDTLGKVTMERIVSAIKYVLKTDGISGNFKCYFGKYSRKRRGDKKRHTNF